MEKHGGTCHFHMGFRGIVYNSGEFLVVFLSPSQNKNNSSPQRDHWKMAFGHGLEASDAQPSCLCYPCNKALEVKPR